MWDALVIGGIGLAGVVVGQQMSRGANREALHLQIEEQRRLELRRLLVRLLVDVRAQIDQAWFLLPLYLKFESRDYVKFADSDTAREMGQRSRRIEEDITTLGLLVPEGQLRVALSQLSTAAVRDWATKTAGVVQAEQPPDDGRDRVEVAYEHVRACDTAVAEVLKQASLYLVVQPQHEGPSFAARVREAWGDRGAAGHG